ncbi:uncharacterized protein LOC105923565 isoform X2 [Fundulus heteroclitus]|uniref:uncharacterized protein LOC105923565 isoform X2 n=1 Tax=Fundulus heteroclitus TaxID=8078 RepID=UPI00165B3612|nr:uncharacterized protein LOC105923565 isoform X2 [Fundulus heteroclitus]
MDRSEDQNTESAAEIATEGTEEPMEEDLGDQAGRSLSGLPPGGNRGAREFPDEPSGMATADQPEVKKQRQENTDQPDYCPKSEAEDNRKYLMECSKCNIKFAPSVKFDQREVNISLHKEKGDDQNPFFTTTLPCTKQTENLEATYNSCQHKLHYKFTTQDNNKGGFDIKLSIEKVNHGDQGVMSHYSKQQRISQEQMGTVTPDLRALEIQKEGGSKDAQPAQHEHSGDVGKPAVKEKKECKMMEVKQKADNSLANSTGSVTNTNEWGKQILSGIAETGMSLFSRFKSDQPNQKLKVKVHFISKQDTFGAADAIKKHLKSNMGSSLQEEKRRDECNMIVVFCPVTPRVESDVNSMMETTAVSSSGKPVILVVMHHTRHADYSTGPYDPRETWKNVVHYVHVLYHETTLGLLKCSENEEAIKDIQQFILKKQQFV